LAVHKLYNSPWQMLYNWSEGAVVHALLLLLLLLLLVCCV
jgi:hypothetical protein